MNKTEKVAISLPRALLRQIEKSRRAKGQSRSAFFRAALETQLRQASEAEADEEYRKAYRERPETKEDADWARATAVGAFEKNPWQPAKRE
jgi:metal-responsive CopG/Arc/MetJ family transcriptional regulator